MQAGHVGVVVLDADQRHAPLGRQRLGVPRRGVVGVQVAGDDLAARTRKNRTRSAIARWWTSTLSDVVQSRPRAG